LAQLLECLLLRLGEPRRGKDPDEWVRIYGGEEVKSWLRWENGVDLDQWCEENPDDR
jgi:hypothetical protein